MTGQWDEDKDAAALLAKHERALRGEGSDEDEDEVDGDFEDLETGEVHKAAGSSAGPSGSSVLGAAGDEAASDEEAEAEADPSAVPRSKMSKKEKRDLKKAKRKAEFDAEYDRLAGGEKNKFNEAKDAIAEQIKFNREEFAEDDVAVRVQYEGFRPGLYVRVELAGVPCELVDYFDSTYPLYLGGIPPQEDGMGYVLMRFKRHRWFPKILKTNDPLILSVGWRRFQTVPLYAHQDDNMRNRMLKYTPEHMHCMASFYGPLAPPGTGVLAINTVAEATAQFRISGTGVVVELDKNADVVKKLKLVGVPIKVSGECGKLLSLFWQLRQGGRGVFFVHLSLCFCLSFSTAQIQNKTAFIRDMFSSSLEVVRYEGASVRTVSGIRGQIKKAIKAPDGAFRATFEDKIVMSDIIFLRTWYPVKPPTYYNPVTSLLTPDKVWRGMRRTGEVRKERQLAVPQNPDSVYKEVTRYARKFAPLRIPKTVERDLPFKTKPKVRELFFLAPEIGGGGKEYPNRRWFAKPSILPLADESCQAQDVFAKAHGGAGARAVGKETDFGSGVWIGSLGVQLLTKHFLDFADNFLPVFAAPSSSTSSSEIKS